ncbi:MAG: hypothetical protein IJS60_11480 [Abditibacteriota bacterium]|nr:hypothetical protein [Abditibacteriota bacterium]
MKKIFLFVIIIIISSVLFSQNLITGNWQTIGSATNSVFDNKNVIAIEPLKHGDGIFQAEIPIDKGYKYHISFKYFIESGSISVLAKHGDNTYGMLQATGLNKQNSWEKFDTIVEAPIGGGHGSLWIIGEGAGKFYVTDIHFDPMVTLNDILTNKLDKTNPMVLTDNYNFDQKALDSMTFDCPLIAQEYHGWKHSPLTDKNEIWYFWWGYPERLQKGSYWRRDTRSAAYPYIGPYTTENVKVAKFSQGQAKNCGLDTIVFEPYEIYASGKEFANEDGFAKLMEAAESIGYHIMYADQMYFAPGEEVHKKDNIISKNVHMVKTYGTRKGYYKIDGKPVIIFRFREGYPPEEVSEIFREINKQSGVECYYILQQSYDQEPYLSIPEVSAFQGPYINDLLEVNSDGKTLGTDKLGVYNWKTINERMESFSKSVKAAGKDWWPWITPSFDSRSQWSHTVYEYFPTAHFNGDNLNVFKKLMFLAKQYNPHGIIITSWNCFGENTALEAKWDGDGYNGDPFYHQKLIAQWKGIKWQDPPAPDKEIVDPLLWWKVFGIDKNGPIIPKSEIRFGDLIVDCEDNTSLPEKLLVSTNGKAYYKVCKTGFESEGVEIINPENINIIEKHGINYIAPKKDSIKFKIDKSLFKENVHIILRYDGNATGDERLISYPSIVDDYVDRIGDTHKGMLPKFWTIDREDSASDAPKITIEPLTHLDLNKDFVIEVRMPVNLIGFESPDTDRVITDYTDIEGLRKRFRQRLFGVELGDVLVLRGVDGLGNIGFPTLLDVHHTGY